MEGGCPALCRLGLGSTARSSRGSRARKGRLVWDWGRRDQLAAVSGRREGETEEGWRRAGPRRRWSTSPGPQAREMLLRRPVGGQREVKTPRKQ